MDFLVERIAGNQVAIVIFDLAVVVGRNRIGLVAGLFICCFIDPDAVASPDLDSILRQVLDDRLAGIREVTLLNLSDFVGVVRHFFIDFV